jgi:F-type H+-transporting ATPase subunit b
MTTETTTASTTEVVTEATGHAAEAAGHAADGHVTGMPQLDFSTFPNQIFWLLVTLALIYFVLSRFALPRIASVLEERAGTITGDIAKADEFKQKAVDAEALYNKALADARVEANGIVGQTREAIKADLAVATAKADAEIAAQAAESEKAINAIRASASDSIGEVARDTAREIIAALGGKPDAISIAAGVATRLKGKS